MTGLDTFRTHFESYTDCYIVIGGAFSQPRWTMDFLSLMKVEKLE